MVLYLILFCSGKSAKHFLTVYREGPVWSGLTPPPRNSDTTMQLQYTTNADCNGKRNNIL